MGWFSTPKIDYKGAAEATGAAAIENTNAQTWANRPNQTTPWGSQTWTPASVIDPTTGNPMTQWSSNTTLDPLLQAALNEQLRMQLARTTTAGGLMNEVANSVGQPLDTSGIVEGGRRQSAAYTPNFVAPNNPIQMGLGPYGAVQSEIDGYEPAKSGYDYNPDIQRGLDYNTNIQTALGDAGKIQSAVDIPTIQAAGVAAAQARTRALQEYMSNTAGEWRQKGQDAALAFMAPNLDRRTAALESQLANMGLTRGSDSWNAEIQRDADQRVRDEFQAFAAGQGEANMLFGQDLQAGQFTNAARQGMFQQDATNAQFQQQANMMSAQLAQQAAIENARNALLEAQFANSAQGQLFGQNLQAGNFANAAQNQSYNQALGAGNFANAAQQQGYNQAQGDAAFYNAAQGQNFNQALGAGNFANAAQNQNYNQVLGAGNFANNAQNLAYTQALGTSGANLGINNANQANRIAAGTYNQGLHQNQLAEQIMLQNLPLNQMNALLSGQQVQNPQMPNVPTAGVAAPPNYLNAAMQQGQQDQNTFNWQQGLMGNVLGSAFSLFGL